MLFSPCHPKIQAEGLLVKPLQVIKELTKC